jgi:glucan phosphoethanolaminetransferase (alkaline phosphatase superfamily)
MENIFNIDCHKSSRGLFVGIIVILLTIVTNIMYFVYKDTTTTIENNNTQSNTNNNDTNNLLLLLSSSSSSIFNMRIEDLEEDLKINEKTSLIISDILELCLIILNSILIICAYLRTRKLTIIEHGNMVFDEALVVIALVGIYIFSVFSILSIVYTTYSRGSIAYLSLVISILSIIEGTLQTMLILDGLRRRALDLKDKRKKPGREIFTLLIMVNLSLWISDTLAFKKFDVSYYQLKYYSILAWAIINTIASPLAIFYRFHSSVCLSDCWKTIYME